MAKIQVRDLNWWHKSLANWMIANPMCHLKDAAVVFDVSRKWLSIVMNSDSFKAYYEELSGKQFDSVSGVIRSEAASMTSMALSLINERLEGHTQNMSTEELLKIGSTGLKALGYGSAPATGSRPTVAISNTVVVDRSALAQARETMYARTGVRASPDAIEIVSEERKIASPEEPQAPAPLMPTERPALSAPPVPDIEIIPPRAPVAGKILTKDELRTRRMAGPKDAGEATGLRADALPRPPGMAS